MRPALALLACVVTLAAIATAPAIAAYAIAFDPSSGRSAASNVSFDYETARRVALDKCGRGCRIVVQGKGGCAAVVESISTGTNAWAMAKGTTRDTATKSAWFECRRKGGVNCRTAAAICD
jgi:hypothetical protein